MLSLTLVGVGKALSTGLPISSEKRWADSFKGKSYQGGTRRENHQTDPRKRELIYSRLFSLLYSPKELTQIFSETPYEQTFSIYANYHPTQVIVYDIGINKRIETPFTYVYHKEDRIFITDISYYDPTCTPEGGQLLQAIAYLNQDEVGNKEIVDQKVKDIEAVYDKHFPSWRDRLVTKRLSKRATVQEIKCIDDQRLMPVKFYGLANAYFAGDWCQGKGQLSELSFSSAYEATSRIMQLAK